MKQRLALLLLGISAAALADTIVLRDGNRISGSYMGGDTREVKIAVGDQIKYYRIEDIVSISFGSESTMVAPTRVMPRPSDRPVESRPQLNPAPAYDRRDAQPVPPPSPEVPAGTNLTVRLIDGVDSERDRVGKTFHASVDEDVVVGGQTVIPRGADVSVKLVDDKQSGKLTGSTVLTLDIDSVMINGRMVSVDTSTVQEASKGRGGKTAAVVGGTAALGAIIGAIAGGGKGAAIGAASGAGVGTAAQVVTKGQRVKIPSETRLTFTLQAPIRP